MYVMMEGRQWGRQGGVGAELGTLEAIDLTLELSEPPFCKILMMGIRPHFIRSLCSFSEILCVGTEPERAPVLENYLTGGLNPEGTRGQPPPAIPVPERFYLTFIVSKNIVSQKSGNFK